MAKWIRRWKPVWIPHGGNFQKADVEEYSDQEPECRCRDPCPSYHQAHHSCDENESNHGSYLASKIAEVECLHVLKDDGWNASRGLPPIPPGLPSTHLSSWQPYPDTSNQTSPVYLKDISSASPQRRKRGHQRSLNHWTHRHLRHLMSAIQSNLASFPTESFAAISLRRRCLVHTRRVCSLGKFGPSFYLGTPLGQFGQCPSRLS